MFESALYPGRTGLRVSCASTVHTRRSPPAPVTVNRRGLLRATVRASGVIVAAGASPNFGDSRRRSVPGRTGSTTVDAPESMTAGVFNEASSTDRIVVLFDGSVAT